MIHLFVLLDFGSNKGTKKDANASRFLLAFSL